MEAKPQFTDPGHTLQGPHVELAATWNLPGGFTNLRLRDLYSERTIEVSRPAVVLGRHTDADVRLAFPEVSRRHCQLFFEDGAWQVRDLDSLNGLYVNGERIQQAPLYLGDHVRVGSVTLVVESGVPGRAVGASAEMLKSIADALPKQAS